MKKSVSDPSETRKPKLRGVGAGGKIVSRDSRWSFEATKVLPEFLGGVLRQQKCSQNFLAAF
jgi:hypothetical protein